MSPYRVWAGRGAWVLGLFVCGCGLGEDAGSAVVRTGGGPAVGGGGPFQVHEAGPGKPYGTWNPTAPARSREFNFLIGRFACEDQLLAPDGSWTRSASEWSASYVLNGAAVQDWYWNDRFAGTSIRTFDPSQEAWLVDFVGMPGVVTGRWVGQPEGMNMVMRQERQDAAGHPVVSRLTFFDITPTSFSWVGEEVRGEDVRPTWKISCERIDGPARPD